eukprot:CAMPEP_0170568126 /NCGR_PEP_ID=MMETSP0211-20121228/80946_1 /TAXON_ID=311385 /ORGANISM="Pseudokeronopsis sp., Strain OXSARD2" /LENGTH=35 /DNA_ID= /DNA_START= /DNA_END= /DNA_ORIENTATION=
MTIDPEAPSPAIATDNSSPGPKAVPPEAFNEGILF